MKTALILGAGASAALGYPCGKELIDRICRKLEWHPNSPRPQREQLIRLGFQEDQINRFREGLNFGNPETIDSFLEHNPDFERLGKVCITLELSSYENEDAFTREAIAIKEWYREFWDGLQKNFSLISRRQLSIITFNYDRSLEHFLFVASHKSRSRDLHDDLAAWLNSDHFVHIHGRMGYLDWQQQPEAETRKYVHDCTEQAIARSAHLILLPHGSKGLDRKVESIMRGTERVLFFGFGFDNRNLQKIGFDRFSEFGVSGVAATMKNVPHDTIGNITRICPMDICPSISHCLKQSGFPNW